MKLAITDDWLGVARKCADWADVEGLCEITVFSEPLGDRAAEALSEFDIILPMRERQPFPRALLERLPNLKLLALTGFHAPHVDLDYCEAKGIICAGSGAYSPAATAELTLALIMAAERDLPRADAAVRAGRFQYGLGLARVLEGKVLGIAGLGRIGARVARYGLALGMDVVAWSANLTDERCEEVGVRRVSKSDLFAHSDIVSLHLMGSPRTRGVVGEEELAAMKYGALLINTARSGLVKSEALISALHAGRIRAAIDVFDEEPVPASNPLVAAPGTVLTPHLGFSTVESMTGFYADSAENILAFLQGRPIPRLLPTRA
jgi:phosphoglycerate dehydrogenase-like enzyme